MAYIGPRQAVIAGGAAGNLACPGIKAGEVLIGVIRFVTGVPSNITAEFSVPADDTINNTGGTVTTGNQLLVTWSDAYWAA